MKLDTQIDNSLRKLFDKEWEKVEDEVNEIQT